MNFEAAIKTINKDFCNLFYAKYLKGAWSITVGYRTVPDYIARMRKQLADWQAANDCNDSLCAESKLQLLPTKCPPGYVYVGPGIIPTKPNGACVISNAALPVDPIDPIVTVLKYATVTDPCVAALNAPLESFGPGCRDRHWWPGNVNEILIASFTR